jgi:hypothetical protein
MGTFPFSMIFVLGVGKEFPLQPFTAIAYGLLLVGSLVVSLAGIANARWGGLGMVVSGTLGLALGMEFLPLTAGLILGGALSLIDDSTTGSANSGEGSS